MYIYCLYRLFKNPTNSVVENRQKVNIYFNKFWKNYLTCRSSYAMIYLRQSYYDNRGNKRGGLGGACLSGSAGGERRERSFSQSNKTIISYQTGDVKKQV